MTSDDSQSDRWAERFAGALKALVQARGGKGDLGALAELRRYKTGQLPSVGAVSPLLAVLPDWVTEKQMADVFLTAGLFADHREHSSAHRSLGASLGVYRAQKHGDVDSCPTDTRLKVLLGSPRAGLDHHLRQAVTLLDGISINYAQLLRDVLNWENTQFRHDGLTYGESVRLRWLRDYDRLAHTAYARSVSLSGDEETS
ncbi:type I-E CRISPR-associated protein Cse2/CasB [Streptosporangium sp. NPDC002607]